MMLVAFHRYCREKQKKKEKLSIISYQRQYFNFRLPVSLNNFKTFCKDSKVIKE